MTLRPATFLCAAMTLSGGAVGPDFKRPEPPTVSGFTEEPLGEHPGSNARAENPQPEPQRFVQQLDIPGQWWAVFHSPGLNTLVERALANNATLIAAQAALRQSREMVYAQEGALLPSISGTYQPSRNQTATGALSLVGYSPCCSLQVAELNVSYVPDVFGGIRRQVEDQRAQALSQRDVADRLRALQADGDVVSTDLLAEQFAAHRLQITQAQQRLGQVSQLALLTVQ